MIKNKNGSGNPFSIQAGKFGRLENFSYRKSWTEDSFVAGKGEGEIVGKTYNLARNKLIAIFIFGWLFVLLGRTAWLQIAKGDYYYGIAEGNRIRIQNIEPKRGVIYDRNFQVLARNKANWMIYFIPADLPKEIAEREKVISRINDILNNNAKEKVFDFEITKAELDKIKVGSLDSYQPFFIAENVEYEKAMRLYLEAPDMPGVFLTNKTQREYNLYSSSLAHILGYTGKINEKELANFGDEYSSIDYIGKTGIEYFWENELKGVNGRKLIEVDALGKEKKIIGQTESEDGRNLVLSLDLPLQKKLEDTMMSYLDKLKLTKASAIIMDPNNGDILAMVSLPTFDNNVFARGISAEEYGQLTSNSDNPLFNRAISGEFPSGSTIKPVMAAAGLQERLISETTSFMSSGGIRVGQWFFPDWKAGGHGVTDVRKALAQSVNTFFYILGGGYEDFIGLGVDKIVQYFKLFGLGTQTGIDLPGEASGFVPTKEWKEEAKNEAWYVGDTYHMSIGQGDVLVTPLQVANYTAAFANGGKLYRPHLVKSIYSGSDQKVMDVQPEIIRDNLIDDYNMKVIREGMRETVTSGSAQSLQSVPVPVAGKTGTAQWSSVKKNHAWFTGFAPYDNPQVAITILIEEGEEGSTVAVPIAKEVLTWYFSQPGR